MLFLTIAQGLVAEDARPLFATCDQRLVAAVMRELQLLAQHDPDVEVEPQPSTTQPTSRKSETLG